MNGAQAWTTALRRPLRRLAARLGAYGAVGAALLVTAIGLGVYTPQLAHQARQLRADGEHLSERLDELRTRRAQQPDPAQRVAQLRERFPMLEQATADLRVVFDRARSHRIDLPKGEYTLVPGAEGSRLRRFEVVLPVNERYVVIKAFVADVLSALPHAGISDLRIERGAASVERLDARVHLTLFYREP
jgi:hypothetical protein